MLFLQKNIPLMTKIQLYIYRILSNRIKLALEFTGFTARTTRRAIIHQFNEMQNNPEQMAQLRDFLVERYPDLFLP